MSAQPAMSEHTVVIERELAAPRELVWRMWTEPDELARWWGPEGFTTPREEIEMDLRPGGVFRMTMVGPDGRRYPNSGHLTVVEPPERLGWAEQDVDSPMMDAVDTTIEFTDLGGNRTRVLMTTRMLCVDELVAMAQMGWGTQLDKLAALLADA